MLAQVRHLQTLNPEELDEYLAEGWFRMGQTIFTTNFLTFNDRLYSAIWLRIALNEFHASKSQQKLMKLNAGFRIEIQKAHITPEKEILFENYKQSVSFEASPSLNHLLYGKTTHDIYDTYEITIHDHDKLIGVGFFDKGSESAAGITSFYDPRYKKHSLGKYLMYLKMGYCKNIGLQYFYPGYFVPGYSYFDYKLNLNKHTLQFLHLSSRQWLPIDNFHEQNSSVNIMHDKLTSLQKILEETKIDSKILRYIFYDANLFPDFTDAELFDVPLFLYSFNLHEESIHPLIIFDVRDKMYHLIRCRQVWKSNLPDNINETYSSHLLKDEENLFSTQVPEEMARVISVILHSVLTAKREAYLWP